MTHSLTIYYRLLVLGLLVLLAGCTSVGAGSGPPSPAGYKSYVTGNAADVVTPTTGLWVLQGGGDDVDENYMRMGDLGTSASPSARSGGRSKLIWGQSS